MKAHAENFGAKVEFDLVESVDFRSGSPFHIKTEDEEYLADAVIITIGADPRKLGVPGEDAYIGTGVSYCGTCDGFFFRGKDIVVVGGGDSALEEGIFLTRFANSVNIIHRRDELRAGIQLQTRAFNNEKISFTWNSVVDEIIGDNGGGVNAVRLKDTVTGEETLHPTEGCSSSSGMTPTTPSSASKSR